MPTKTAKELLMTKKKTVKKKVAKKAKYTGVGSGSLVAFPAKTTKKKKTKKKVAKKLPKVYTFLGLKLENLFRDDLWFVSETLANGENLYVELEKDGKDFSAMLKYNGIFLEAPISVTGELALELLLEDLQNMINPLVELGV